MCKQTKQKMFLIVVQIMLELLWTISSFLVQIRPCTEEVAFMGGIEAMLYYQVKDPEE